MSWTYQQSTGRLVYPTVLAPLVPYYPIGAGYAGRDEGKNNPDMQNVKGIGPIPVGTYTAQPPADDPVVGKYALRLTPSPTNEMFGRNSFFMHGDSTEHPGFASHGCIVMPHIVRAVFWNSGCHTIEVIR